MRRHKGFAHWRFLAGHGAGVEKLFRGHFAELIDEAAHLLVVGFGLQGGFNHLDGFRSAVLLHEEVDIAENAFGIARVDVQSIAVGLFGFGGRVVFGEQMGLAERKLGVGFADF